MKSVCTLVLLLALSGSSVLARDIQSVKLIGPERIALSGAGCDFWELPFEIEFTWDRDTPLTLDLYVINGVIKAGPYAEFTLRDKTGREVQVWCFVSMPSVPAGQITVRKGQRLRVPIYAWNGMAQVTEGETYTISASLSARLGASGRIDLISDTRHVVFSCSATKQSSRPNNSPEPTPGSVTPAASARAAPPPSAAQL